MFQFSIRDVVWLTVVVALAVGWYCDRSLLQESWARQARVQAELLRSFQVEAARARASEAASKNSN